MNKAFIRSAQRLASRAVELNPNMERVCDVGAGSGQMLKHLHDVLRRPFVYHAIDLSPDGLALLRDRAKALGIDQVQTVEGDVSESTPYGDGNFDAIVSHFCIYTIKDPATRRLVFENMFKALKPGGTVHIATTSELYGAAAIARQCLADELDDARSSWGLGLIRAGLLVPYQWRFVLRPIEARVNAGEFVRFSGEQIRNEVGAVGFEVEDLRVDYGGCGYHLHARRPKG